MAKKLTFAKFSLAKKTRRGELVFDSRIEADRYDKLRTLEKSGVISNLRRQVRYHIDAFNERGEKKHLWDYIADFVYLEKGKDKDTVEDVKSAFTVGLDIFKKKKQFMRDFLDIEVVVYMPPKEIASLKKKQEKKQEDAKLIRKIKRQLNKNIK